MLTLNSNPYISLDNFLPLDSIPAVESAVAQSYDYIHQNSWQKFSTLDNKEHNSNGYVKQNIKTIPEFFALEVVNKTVTPYWVLDLTTGHSGKSCYDSVETPADEWNAIELRKDLPAVWDSTLKWFEDLTCFTKLGRIALLITRPGLPIHYHIDTGGYEARTFVPYKHRQEFFWLNMSPEKTVYILNDDRNTIKFDCRSAFFNHHNWHGSHESLPYWSFSYKVEGIFTEEFRNQIGIGNLEYYYYE